MRKFRVARVSGISYTIRLAKRGEIAEEADKDGICEYHQQRIQLDEAMQQDRLGVTLLHELLHAVLHESGANELLKGEMRDPDKIDAFEERLVSAITPSLCEALISIGWKPPTFPKKKAKKS